MPENTRTQSKHFIVKFKKTFHIITALAFFLQQLVPYSSAFAMSDDEEADPSNPAVSPFTPSSTGFTEHPTFLGKFHGKVYEIWKELSEKEAERLRPLIAKEVPLVTTSEKIGFTLGKGKFGTTYAGRNLETREIFAIKEVHGQSYIDESLQEGKIVRSLGDYIHIMPLIDYMHFSYGKYSRLIQVMHLAYINGDGFKEMLAHLQTAQREKIVADSFYQMMMGLEYIHRQGVVHLDIKADNTLYMKDGTLRIADFGRAKEVGDNDKITDPYNGLGARKKYSPEIVALFRKHMGRKFNIVHSFSGKGADVWAAGLYIWELLEDKSAYYSFCDPLPKEDTDPLRSWAELYTDEHFETYLEKINFLKKKFSFSLINLLRSTLNVDPELRLGSSQIIKKLSSSAMKPDDRKAAFEELIQVYKNPGTLSPPIVSENDILESNKKQLLLEDPDEQAQRAAEEQRKKAEEEEARRAEEENRKVQEQLRLQKEEELKKREELLSQREADLQKQIAEEEEKSRQTQLAAEQEKQRHVQREADLQKQIAEEEEKSRQTQLAAEEEKQRHVQREAELQKQIAEEEEAAELRKQIEKRRQAIPRIAWGHEDVYERFLKGRLIYKPNKENDVGIIELRIADLVNPLEGEFDLSKCGDAAQYLSINTGYRKAKRPENARKVEIWFVPRFLIEKNLAGSASHFKDIMGSWDALTAPVGTFFTWGNWDDLGWYDYATKLTWDEYNDPENNLKKVCNSGAPTPRPQLFSVRNTRHMSRIFHVIF